jgi:flagellar hook-associated protein 3 FlgL
MRITEKIRFNTTRSDLNRLHNRSNKIYKELSTGKRINRPSDDPFGALQATGLHTHRRLLDQYSRSIDTARINLFAADNALGQAVSILTQARTTTLTAVSVVGDDKSHTVMADTISELKEQLFNLSNSRVADTFVFGGFQSTRKPYTLDSVTGRVSYRGDTGAMQLEVGEGALIETTLKGTSAFGGGSQLANVVPGSGYTGLPTVMGEYDGSLGNVNVNLRVINGGSPDVSTFSLSFNGGAVDNNGGAGYTLTELNQAGGPLSNIGVQLRLPDDLSAFTNVTGNEGVDLQLIQSDNEDVFALLDELELALREFDDIGIVSDVDYDGNGIVDTIDLDDAEALVVAANSDGVSPGGGVRVHTNPLTGAELNAEIRRARRLRFSEIANTRVQNLLGRIDTALNQVSDNQSLVGLGLNKVDSADAANSFLSEQVVTTLAHVEDADFIEAVSELSLIENALQASTSTTSRVLQGISLLDYLR